MSPNTESSTATGADAGPADNGLPLHGITVLDMSRFQPGAYLTKFLAELGANVIKVERPGSGSPERMIEFSASVLHHSKRSLGFNTRDPRAGEVLERLVANADVVVESNAPGSLDKNNMGYERFSAVNPGIVWCAVTGFGGDGPYVSNPGHDINYLAQSGLLAGLAGESELPNQPAVLLGGPVAALVGAAGILAALTKRNRTGKGSFVDTSITDSLMWLMAEDIARAGRGMPPWNLNTPDRASYMCSDGNRISMAASEPRTWAGLCAGLGLDLGERPGGDPADAENVRASLAAAFATKPAAEWVSQLGGAGVASCNTTADLPTDPHVVGRQSISDVEFAGTTDKVVTGPLRFSGVSDEARRPKPAPAVGADTSDVLAAAGFSEAEIAELTEAGVVG